MAGKFYHLPNLTDLSTFDACAALTQSARELDVTSSAVRKQVKSLETGLECMLFKHDTITQ